MALNNDGWFEIFESLDILRRLESSEYFDITADQIKKYSGREPRLMAKIDFKEHLPKIMSDNGLAMLAITNGSYRIGRFNPFIPINPISTITPQSVSLPSNIITLNADKLAHESAVLDAAAITGMLRNVFKEQVVLTIRGRNRSPNFSFSLNGVPFNVGGVQVEVDGGYEGDTSINLVEAKIGPRENLSIRQLLYPQLSWQVLLGDGRKVIRTFICFFQEPIVRFIPVVFHAGTCAADHANEVAFIIEPEARLNLSAISIGLTSPLPDIKAPFPQADNMETVLAMLRIVASNISVAKDSLQLEFGLTDRQIDYYSNVLRWLGFSSSANGFVQITRFGKQVADLPHATKVKKIAEIVFSEPIFHHALRSATNDAPAAMYARWRVSASTISRRAQTVKAWIKYFESLT